MSKTGSSKKTASKAASSDKKVKAASAKTPVAKSPVAKVPVAKVPAKKAAAKKAAAPKKAAASKPAATRAVTARKAAPKKPPAAEVRDSATETLDLVLARLDAMKAEETVTIDLRGKSAFSDYLVVTTGRSNRHVGAVAENVAKGLKEAGQKKLHVEGMANCDWVLIDTGEVILHVFRPEVREFYNIERLWAQNTQDDARVSLKAV